jgi:hypothetical protein
VHDKYPYARKWKFIKWGTGLLSLYLDARLRKRRKSRPLDIVIIDALMNRCLTKPSARPFSSTDRDRYLKATNRTIYWHGTGRLQHGKQDDPVDVLVRMLKQQGLRPFRDVFDVKQGEMVSTSVARQRMYARIYADMHAHKGADLRKLYGSPRFWAYYFIMAINLHAIKELGLWSRKARNKQQAIWREQGQKLWTVKVTKKDGSSVGKFFNDGSDIAGNYPIIIGLKQAKYHLLKTAAYVGRYESRIGSSIPIEAFTHLEIPASKTAEVTLLLKKYGYKDLPVFAIEQCEKLHAQKNFSELVA